MLSSRLRLLSAGSARCLTGTVLATGALIATTAPGAAAATFGTQGIDAGPGVSQQTVDRQLGQAARTGAKLIRVQADWASLQPTGSGQRAAAAVDALDRVTAGAARRRMKVVLSIGNTPCWASAAPDDVRGSCSGPSPNSQEVTRYQPASADSVVDISAFLAGRYANRLAAFQIWNEPDQQNEKYFAGPGKISKYVAMTKALYPALKRAAPKVPVLAGSFVGVDGRWLNALYDAGMKGSYDGLAVQLYSQTLASLRLTRSVQRAHGDRTPLWLTEFGYSSCYRRGGPATQIDQVCYTNNGAARGIRDVLTGLRNRSYVKAAIVYELEDDGPGGYTFGLFDRRGKAKATYLAVRRVLRGTYRKPVRPTLRLRRSGGGVTATGTATVTERLTLTVRKAGNLRYRATFYADSRNRYSIAIPPSLGTRGLKVRISAGYTGGRTAKR